MERVAGEACQYLGRLVEPTSATPLLPFSARSRRRMRTPSSKALGAERFMQRCIWQKLPWTALLRAPIEAVRSAVALSGGAPHQLASPTLS